MPFLVAAMLVSGCATVTCGQMQPRGDLAVTRTETAYPTGDRATSIVLLERFMPAEVRAGQSFEYSVRITNLTSAELQDLVLTEQYPAEFKVSAIQPEPESSAAGRATWQWAKLGPRASQTLRIRGSSDGPEAVMCCAKVTFGTVICAETPIVQPELVLTKSAPSQVLVCDPIPLRFVVRNAGTGVAYNVRITDTLPDGWETEDGRTALQAEAGDLAAGQSREFAMTVRATRTGEFTNTARAVEDGGLSASASTTTAVRQPVLVVSKQGPEFRYLGRPAKFVLTVANQGDAPAEKTVLVDALPEGAEFVSASQGGRLEQGRIRWDLGTIAAGDSKSVDLTLKPTQLGTIQNTAIARAVCAEGSGAASLEVRGIPAILLEAIDVADPIEVGSNETYEITVLNQGSAVGTNIQITCTLVPEQEYVSATGPTEARVEARTVTFQPLPSLAPQAKATYRVVVKGVTAGDVRFRVVLTSDQVTSPVEETESTHIY